MRFALSFVALVLATTSIASAADDKYPINGENSSIGFVGTKKDGKHTGGFKTFTGNATVKGEDVSTLKVSVEIDMNSTYSDNDKLTTHLKSPDFFGVKANPKSKFAGKVVKKGDGYVVQGELTLNGKKKAVTFPAEVTVSGGTLTVAADLKIDRTDFGITYGKGMVDNEVSISLKVKASKG